MSSNRGQMSVNATKENGRPRDSSVVCKTSQGTEIHGSLTRFSRHAVVFEVYDPTIVLRTSEVFPELRINFQARTIYSGRAVIRNVLHTGTTLVCESSLDDAQWIDLEFNAGVLGNSGLRVQFNEFIHEWQKSYQIAPEYKLIIADMHSYFRDLRLWLDQVELGLRSNGKIKMEFEPNIDEELSHIIIPSINVLFEKFEAIAQGLDTEAVPAHQSYMRRHLHPLVLCAPFANRTFHKPLGYAGDYEMVNMIARNRPEGGSLFARVINTWFLRQPPAEAHRNRIDYLAKTLEEETMRVCRLRRRMRVFNMACGPAQEVQRFLRESPFSSHVELTMLDFNEETLGYVRSALDDLRKQRARSLSVEYLKKSVHQILREDVRRPLLSKPAGYDFVYCAGLFDYLSNPVCQRLMNIMYDWLLPGGLLVATNVEPSNPLRWGMEHLLDWHLIYRTPAQMRRLVPDKPGLDAGYLRTDSTGVNVLIEIRKPDYA